MSSQADAGSLRDLVVHAASTAAEHRDRAAKGSPFPTNLDISAMRSGLGSLRDEPTTPAATVEELIAAVTPGLVATTGPRYFGFVIGGALHAPTAADILTTGWDQPAFNAYTSPAAAVVEEVTGSWLKDVLGLPASMSFGFVTGAQGANTVGLAAARHAVLERAGWNVELHGLHGAPRVRVVANGERHATVDRALRLLGLGTAALEPVATDDQGRIDVVHLESVLAADPGAPAIVCLQAGNVNTGAFDDIAAAVDVARRHGAWTHVDGAFGLWAAATPRLRHLTVGLELVDSCGLDGHKWLNVPYDSGYVFCAHPDTHAAAMSYTASYLTGQGEGQLRSPGDYVLESSRRARGFATWAALRQLGRHGLAELIERCCDHAKYFAEQLAASGIEVVNDVVLNQVLVSFGDDRRTDQVIAAVQESGVCWMGGTNWKGRRLMRIAISNWSTTRDDIDQSVAAVLNAASRRPTEHSGVARRR